MSEKRNHWNAIFARGLESQSGWYEKQATQTFRLLGHIPDQQNPLIFLPGAGTSGLVEELLATGAELVVNDISSEALARIRERLGDQAKNILWLCQDISQPLGSQVPDVDIWFDRAVLHFLTDAAEINGYFENLRLTLKVGGYAAFAEFSKTGARKCSGLDVHRYSVREYTARLGSSFELIASFEHTYRTPDGEPRPYVYALFRMLDRPK